MEFFSNKNILIISPESWGLCYVSKHHYATHLTKMGNRVFFLSKGQHEQATSKEGVTLLKMPDIPPGIRFFPEFIRKKIHRYLGKKISSSAKTEFDVIWSFDTSVLYDLDCIGERAYRILHIVDLSMDFQWVKAAKSANICLGSSSIIVDKLKTINKNSHFIHHGLFNTDTDAHRFKTSENVVYAGNINIRYLDKPRLEKLINKYPNVTFHFIGDVGQDNLTDSSIKGYANELSKLFNVEIHGSMNPEKLRSYLLGADVLLICYDLKFRNQVSNPHKVMEYLSTGKPILATITEEYKELTELICMKEDESEYINALAGLLAENDEKKAVSRKEFAFNNTYSHQINRISQIIIDNF